MGGSRFDGSILLSPLEHTWTDRDAVASVIFDRIDIDLARDPLARAQADGRLLEEERVATLTASEILRIDGVDLPFTIFTPAYEKVQSWMIGGEQFINWGVSARLDTPLFLIQRGDVIYKGTLALSMNAYVPEPSTALLMGVGLAGLLLNGRRRAVLPEVVDSIRSLSITRS